MKRAQNAGALVTIFAILGWPSVGIHAGGRAGADAAAQLLQEWGVEKGIAVVLGAARIEELRAIVRKDVV